MRGTLRGEATFCSRQLNRQRSERNKEDGRNIEIKRIRVIQSYSGLFRVIQSYEMTESKEVISRADDELDCAPEKKGGHEEASVNPTQQEKSDCETAAPPAPASELKDEESAERMAMMASIRALLKPHEISPSKEDLQRASQELKALAPYNFEAWRLHADLLLNAIRQLETRELQPDASFKLLAIPLRLEDLTDAAEAALRECARFARSEEQRVALVDEANSIRRTTWF